MCPPNSRTPQAPQAPYEAQLHVSKSAVDPVEWSLVAPPPGGPVPQVQVSKTGLVTAPAPPEGGWQEHKFTVRAVDGLGRTDRRDITFIVGEKE